MLDEDVVLKTMKNGNERLLLANVLLMVGVTSLIIAGDTQLAAGVLLGLGIIAPINMFSFKRNWVDASPFVGTHYFLILLPFFASLILTLFGLLNPAVREVYAGGREYFELVQRPELLISAAFASADAILPELETLACVACAASIFLITDSRYTIRKIILYSAAIASVFALFGIIYTLLSTIDTFSYLPPANANSFSTFPDTSQWSAFAIIWTGGALAMAIYTSQRFRIATFVKSLRCALLLIASICFASVMMVGTPLEKTIIMSIALLAFSILVIDTIPTESNLRRHYGSSRALRAAKERGWLNALPCFSYVLFSITLAFGIFVVVNSSWNNPNEMMIVDSENPKMTTLHERQNILADTRKMIEERPYFGWGTGSFREAFAFFQGADLGTISWSSPKSDLLQKLAENGIVGLAISASMPLALLLAWIVRRSFSTSGMVIALTCLSVLVLAVFSNPFHCLSVQMSFWALLMSLFRWDNAVVK